MSYAVDDLRVPLDALTSRDCGSQHVTRSEKMAVEAQIAMIALKSVYEVVTSDRDDSLARDAIKQLLRDTSHVLAEVDLRIIPVDPEQQEQP